MRRLPRRREAQVAGRTTKAIAMSEAVTDEQILPTHTCFDDCLENMSFCLQKNRATLTDGTLLIVHGIITTHEGNLGAHAWIELDGKTVMDSGIWRGQKISYD